MPRRKVIIVDDDLNYREGLRGFLSREADVVAYASPDEFAQNMKNPPDLQGVSLIVLDYAFDTFNARDKDLIGLIRDDLAYRGNMVLWSLEDNIPKEYKQHFNAVLPKRIFSLAEIDQCLNTSS